jgi:hypothetical protein
MAGFRVLDAGGGRSWRMAAVYACVRPAAVWPMEARAADAIYLRSETGGGTGKYQRNCQNSGRLVSGPDVCRAPTGFKHTACFRNSCELGRMPANSPLEVAHDGRRRCSISLPIPAGHGRCAAAVGGVHVDAAKGRSPGQKATEASGLRMRPCGISWTTAQVCHAGLRRGNGIRNVMDPPS